MRLEAFYTIPPGCAFARDLAKGVLAQAGTPEQLAQTLILVPTRRAQRALSAAFLSSTDGQAMLLPKIKAIGDIDDDSLPDALLPDVGELPPAIPEMRRLCLIARQVQSFPIGGQRPSEVQAFALARALISLFDQMQNADFDPQELASLWPQELAAHWHDIAQFMTIMTQYWPAILKAEKAMDPVQRRLALLQKQLDIWQQNPPDTPVIVAGSTGTLPATQRLMKLVASLPRGQIIFPGLIPHIDEQDWQVISQDKVHPFHPLSITLKALSLTLKDVRIWPASEAQSKASQKRQSFLTEIMRPASQTDKWRALGGQKDSFISADSFAGFQRLEAQDSHEEAEIIALLLRAQLETPQRTAILVTPDRQLAQMVRTHLRRFHIEIDDSAGESLALSKIGNFLILLARLVDSSQEIADLVTLASHPYCSAMSERQSFRQSFDKINKRYLRGTLSISSLDELIQLLDERAPDDALFLQEGLQHALAPLKELASAQILSLAKAANSLGQVAERLAAKGDSQDAEAEAVHSLWSGPEGEGAANLLREMASFGHDFEIRPSQLADTLLALMSAVEVRKPYQRQARIGILGAVESRMLSADLVILSGLNEGIWPPKPNQDLWMNQSMAAAIGLPHRQWRIALSAHDFLMAAAQKEVIITRARRQNDRPTLPSRWLTRMDAVMKAARIEDLIAPRLPDDIAAILAYQRSVTAQPIAPPAPKPPLENRPNSLSATQFDRLIADPYGVYADKILGLRKLRPVNEAPGPLLKGNLFHEALQLFVASHPEGQLTPHMTDELLALAKPLFAPYMHHYEVAHFWWPQLESLADWFMEHDNRLRGTGAKSHVETKGEVIFDTGGRPIHFTAKADRIVISMDGSAHIIDYKTGTVPSKKSVEEGRSTQMLVEAALLEKQGFSQIGHASADHLEYWKLRGRGSPITEIKDVSQKDLNIDEVFEAMCQLALRFENEDMAYWAEPDPRTKPSFSDYRHLARIKEWRAGEADNE